MATTYQLIYIWSLLIIAATLCQMDQIKMAFKLFKVSRSGLYVYQVREKLYVYHIMPTTFAEVADPDMIVTYDGSFLFYQHFYLHKSIILTFLPIIPGVAYLLLRCRIRHCRKSDKYTIKDEYVNELKSANTGKGR